MQMKKTIIAILAILYLGSSSGFGMDIHYCMGKQSGVDLFSVQKPKCAKCGMTDKKGCCQDKHQFYKLKDVHQSVTAFAYLAPPEFALTSFFIFNNSDIIIKDVDSALLNNSPPNFVRPSLCILNCVFRI